MKTSEQEKVEFIIKNYPEIKKINAFMDIKFINQLKKDMGSAGLYQLASISTITDQRITRLILAAQGEAPRKFHKSTTTKQKENWT